MTKVRKTNQLKAGVILSYATMGIEYLISLLYTPILISLLGQSEYGNYNYVASVVNYLTLFSAGFGSAYVRFYSRIKADPTKGEEDVHRMNGMFFSIFAVLGVIVLVLGFVLSFYSEQVLGGSLTPEELAGSQTLVQILVVNVFITFLSIVFNSYVIAHEKFIYQKLLVLFQYLVRPLIILPIVYMGYKSAGVAAGTMCVSTLALVANVWYCVGKEKMRFSFQKFDFSLLKEITVFSSFLLISLVVDQVNWSVGKFVLGKVSGTIAVAVYSVAALLNSYYRKFATYISNVFVPRVNRMIMRGDSDEKVTDLFIRIGRLQYIILALIATGFVFFGQAFINLWVGPEYAEAYAILIMLTLPVTIPEIQKLGLEILKAKNQHKFRSLMLLIMAAVNVLISIPLGMRFGGLGCAMGTAFSVLVGNGLIMNIYYQKRAGVNVIRFWKEIVRMSRGVLPAVAVGLLIVWVIPLRSWFSLVLWVGVYTLAYIVGLWGLGLNTYEKKLFARLLRKLPFMPMKKAKKEVVLPADFDYTNLKTYSGYYLDETLIRKSASGGAASAMAQSIIRADGVVFGAVYAPDWKSAIYAMAETEEELVPMKGSKYINVEKMIIQNGEKVSVFKAVAEQLEKDRKVLFTGLGCDVGALMAYCTNHQIPMEQLYTVDLICHGPTFAEAQKQFIEKLEKKYASDIASFNVRYKKKGWTPPYIRAQFKNGKVFEKPFYETELGYAFKIYSRNACFDCRFKGENHAADVTVGDYWGLRPNMPGYHPQGVSVFFVRTERGQQLLDMIDRNEFELMPADTEHALRGNRMFYESRAKAKSYDAFEANFKKAGLFEAVRRSPGKKVLRKRTMNRVVREMIPGPVRKALRRLLKKMM